MEATQHINNLHTGHWHVGQSLNSVIGANKDPRENTIHPPKGPEEKWEVSRGQGVRDNPAKEKRNVKKRKREILNHSTTEPSTFQVPQLQKHKFT